MARQRIPLRTIKKNANAAAVEARSAIAAVKNQAVGSMERVEVKTLEVLTSLLESVNTITDLIEDLQKNGVKGELEFMGRTIPVSVRVFPAGDPDKEEE